MAKQASKQGLTASLAPRAHFPQRLPAYLNLLAEKAVFRGALTTTATTTASTKQITR